MLGLLKDGISFFYLWSTFIGSLIGKKGDQQTDRQTNSTFTYIDKYLLKRKLPVTCEKAIKSLISKNNTQSFHIYQQ